MICDFESLSALVAYVGPQARLVWVRLSQVSVGEDRVGLMVDGDNQLVGVVAERLSAGLCDFVKRADFGEPATECTALESGLGCGYCFVRYSTAQWLTRDGVALAALRPHVAEALGREAA